MSGHDEDLHPEPAAVPVLEPGQLPVPPCPELACMAEHHISIMMSSHTDHTR